MKISKHVIYKITNTVNGKIYIGAHSTTDINDSYMGSGNNIKLAIKKHGVGNFTKDILYVFDCVVECYKKESEIVNEKFISRKDTYNISLGGLHGPAMKGDKHPLYGTKRELQSELMKEKNPSRLPHVRKMLLETKVVKDGDSYKRVCKSNQEYENINTGKVTVRDSNGVCSSVPMNDPRILSGELEHITKGRFKAKDKDGNMFFIRKDDERFISGELVGFMKNTKTTCPHCKKTGGGGAMKRWHFDNCKFNSKD